VGRKKWDIEWSWDLALSVEEGKKVYVAERVGVRYYDVSARRVLQSFGDARVELRRASRIWLVSMTAQPSSGGVCVAKMRSTS
jgi:hypothetical protein